MRAAVYHAVGDVRVEDVPEPEPGPGEVKLRVAFNGLCGSDLHEVFDGPRAIPTSPHPLTGAMAPLILGHETAGHVVGVGAGVDDLDEGALAVIEPMRRCGVCEPCLAGDVNLCDVLAFHGLSTGGGGLAEFTVVPREMVHLVPPNVDAASAAMVEPLAVAHHAVRRSGAAAGRSAVVMGGGPIGIGLVLSLRFLDVEAVVVEPSADRRAVLASLGIATLDPADAPVEEQVRDLTGGRGADICFETAAVPASLASAIASAAKHGVVMMLASPRQPLPPVLGQAMAKELEIRTSYAYCGDFPAVIEGVAAGRYPFDGWVSTMPLGRVVEALDLLRAGQRLKLLIDPTS